MNIRIIFNILDHPLVQPAPKNIAANAFSNVGLKGSRCFPTGQRRRRMARADYTEEVSSKLRP